MTWKLCLPQHHFDATICTLSLSTLQLLGELITRLSWFSAPKVWQNIGKFKQTVHFIWNGFTTGIGNTVSLLASFYGPGTWWASSWQTHSSSELTSRLNVPQALHSKPARPFPSCPVFPQPQALITNGQTSLSDCPQSIHRYTEETEQQSHTFQKWLIF